MVGSAVDRIMHGQRPPGREARALEKTLVRMAELSGDAEAAAAELKTLSLPDREAAERYLTRLELCEGDLRSAREAHGYLEKEPAMAAGFARLAPLTPGPVSEVLAHCEHLRRETRPGPERERALGQWVEVLREQQLRSPEEVAAYLARPAPAPTPSPGPAPGPVAPAAAPPEPPGPGEIAAAMLTKQPVAGLTPRKLSRALDTTAEYLNGLEPAQKELEQVLAALAGQPRPSEGLERYLRFLELSDGRDGQALEAFLHVEGRDEKARRAAELMLGQGHTVDELRWLESKLPPKADLAEGARRYADFMQSTPDRQLFERALQLPPEAAARLRSLEEVGVATGEALDDLAHLAAGGFKPDEFKLLRSLRERAPTGDEVRQTLDFLRGAPAGETREQRARAYLKLVEVANDPAEALEDLRWLAADRPPERLAEATETYLDLLGRVRPEQQDDLRECYQKLHENAPPASSPRGWFSRPVTYEGAFGTLLEFDPDPEEALSDLRLLQKHASTDLRGGLADLKDLYKLSNARDSASVRTAYELLQAPPAFLSRSQMKKLVIQLSREADDLGLGARMARLLSHSPTEGEFRARRKAFSEYLELGNSSAQTVGLLETAERCLPPTDDLLKIHPVLLEHNRSRSPELVGAALEQASLALARGRVDGQSSSGLFRTYLGVLCKCERPDEVATLGEMLRTEGDNAWTMARAMDPLIDGCEHVGRAIEDFRMVRDLRDQEWPDCPASLEELARVQAGSRLVLRQVGHDPGRGARELMAWSFQHKQIGPTELLTEVGRRLVMGAPIEKAKAEALEHFENGGRIKDREDHVVIGGIRIGKREGQA